MILSLLIPHLSSLYFFKAPFQKSKKRNKKRKSAISTKPSRLQRLSWKTDLKTQEKKITLKIWDTKTYEYRKWKEWTKRREYNVPPNKGIKKGAKDKNVLFPDEISS
jgi:hypothetical protein